MVIAIVDTRQQPDLCANIVRGLLPRATCVITPAVRDLWKTDTLLPPLSGVLVNERVADVLPEEQETLADMARRFPVACVGSGEADLTAWATRCLGFTPQLPRQPDRLPWKSAVLVACTAWRGPRMCSTENVSVGGLFIAERRSNPSVGARLDLRFPTLGSRVAATAVVRWVQPRGTESRAPGYGCEFVETDLWVSGVLVGAARTAALPG